MCIVSTVMLGEHLQEMPLFIAMMWMFKTALLIKTFFRKRKNSFCDVMLRVTLSDVRISRCVCENISLRDKSSVAVTRTRNINSLEASKVN
ncbi:hypothetical protein evm_001166 [Chilo suppressalis]|nr:hypothetical protein evm_001166 [Chilo suppressalis]